jgi:para-aminobenzoate synthetase component 1
MRSIIQEIQTAHSPESLAGLLHANSPKGCGNGPSLVLLRSGQVDSAQGRYSFVAADPFLVFRSFGSRCELRSAGKTVVQFGNPWHILDGLMARFELLEEPDFPFPLGGCFGYWGYDLKNFVEPKLAGRPVNDLELPDCHVGFYDSQVVFDHHLGKTWIVSTGLDAEGSRDLKRANQRVEFWTHALGHDERAESENEPADAGEIGPCSNLTRAEFIALVRRAQEYIRAGDIYQVNLSHRIKAVCPAGGWDLYRRLAAVSPAPFSAFLECGDFQVVSSSPERFLLLSGPHIVTRPIKGTRPRSADPSRDAQLTYELQTSPKEMAELIMITDLLRNDLGRVCEYGSVQVPELVRLERYPQVQHLVSTVEGRLRQEVTHFSAFSSCFPGGSVTGTPKFRAMQIIDELEPVSRGPYTGALGYLGFNRESQLSIVIRAAVCKGDAAWFHAGAGIVADSDPAAEYEETLAKARGFFEALRLEPRGHPLPSDGRGAGGEGSLPPAHGKGSPTS